MGKPTEEEFATWWHPSDAIDQFLALGDDEAHRAVLAMLGDGLIAAVAERVVVNGKVTRLQPIDRGIWSMMRDPAFWWTSRFRIRATEDTKELTYSVYGVRLDPQAILREAPPRPVVPSAVETPFPFEPTGDDRTPVARAALDKWFDLYRLAYPDGGIEHAWSSAKGMFPNKSVTRRQVRALMPDRPKGRPRKNKDNP